MDGLAALSLKPSVIEQHLLSHADVAPGSLVKGTVTGTEDYGIFVQLTPSLK